MRDQAERAAALAAMRAARLALEVREHEHRHATDPRLRRSLGRKVARERAALERMEREEQELLAQEAAEEQVQQDTTFRGPGEKGGEEDSANGGLADDETGEVGRTIRRRGRICEAGSPGTLDDERVAAGRRRGLVRDKDEGNDLDRE